MKILFPPLASDIAAAATRLQPYVHRTPVMQSDTLNRLSQRQIYCKGELFQKTGSFKFRGAMNALLQLNDEEKSRGVLTHSSGNHGQALAKAAQVLGLKATIVLPDFAPEVKRRAIEEYGAQIFASGPSLKEREERTLEIHKLTGAIIIPPFDHPDIIAGQGTAAWELLQDHPDLEALVAPIGGGGLISGFALARQLVNPAIRVYGAEPAGASTAYSSKLADDRITLAQSESVAEGLLANRLGQLTWSVIRDEVDHVFTVTEEEITTAMRFIWERMKLVVEPSAAVGVAVILSKQFQDQVQEKKIGVVLCGGNANLDRRYW